MYPLNRTGQKSKNLTNNNMYICMYIESVRQSISVKIHQHKYRFLAKRKNFSVLYFFGILLFFFLWKVFHILIFLHLTMEVLYRRKEKKRKLHYVLDPVIYAYIRYISSWRDIPDTFTAATNDFGESGH